MENELTPRAQMKYSVKSTMDSRWSSQVLLMDENIEVQSVVPQKKDEEKALNKPDTSAEVQLKAQKQWERFLREKAQKGEKITPEDQQKIMAAIRKGEGPTVIGGGSGDGKFENFDADKYKGTELKELAEMLKNAGSNNMASEEFVRGVASRAREIAGAGGQETLAGEFIKDMNAIITGTATPEQEINENRVPSRQMSAEEAKVRSAKERSGNPRSIQEVAQGIILDEGADRWGEGGAFPLLDADGNLKQENFVRWFRERMMYHHTSNSRDFQLRLGDIVGITNQFGNTTSIFSMDKDRGQYFLDIKSGRVLDKLAFQLKNELWLFGVMRNHDLLYQHTMGSDADLPKILADVHGKEEITQPDSLKTIMTMSKDFNPEGGDTAVGDAVRKAYEIYFYASDFPELQKLLGKDSKFFKKQGFIDAFKIIEKKEAGDDSISEDARKFIDKIFPEGKLDPVEFISQMNPFNAQNKSEFNKNIMREMVRCAIAEKYGLEYGLDKSTKEQLLENGKVRAPERTSVRNDLEYAEWWAWILTRWTGAAARNDTEAIGFDAQTKLMKFRDYRVRQSSESRAGQFGNEYDLPVFKSLMSDFFNGVTVEKRVGEAVNTTPFDLFRKLDEIEDDPNLTNEQRIVRKKEVADRFKFEQSTQRAFLANHINRAFEIFHSTMGAEEMKLEEIVKWDPFRGIILDRGKFEEQVKEKFLKPIRYAFSTYAQLDFGKTEKVLKKVPKKGELPEYDDLTVAEKIFGPEVLTDIKKNMLLHWREVIREKEKKNKDPLTPREKEILNRNNFNDVEKKQLWSEYLSSQGRSLLWKRAAMARMAAHIKSHRQFANTYAPFSIGMVNTLYEALESIKSVEIDPEDETTMNYAKRFLTKEDIDWIRKHSGTTQRRMFIQDILFKSGGYGLAKGVWEGAGIFIKDIFKS